MADGQVGVQHVAGQAPPEHLTLDTLRERMTQIEEFLSSQIRPLVSTREEHLVGICAELAAAVRFLLDQSQGEHDASTNKEHSQAPARSRRELRQHRHDG